MNPPRIPDDIPQSASRTQDPPSRLLTPSSVPLSKRGLPTMSAGKENQKEQKAPTELEELQTGDVLGHFSYAPATETTVVTTTRTTTTKLPPLRMKAPHYLNDLDPRLYPLASSPTPPSIRRLQFHVEGRPIMFQEAEDNVETSDKVRITLQQNLFLNMWLMCPSS